MNGQIDEFALLQTLKKRLGILLQLVLNRLGGIGGRRFFSSGGLLYGLTYPILRFSELVGY